MENELTLLTYEPFVGGSLLEVISQAKTWLNTYEGRSDISIDHVVVDNDGHGWRVRIFYWGC